MDTPRKLTATGIVRKHPRSRIYILREAYGIYKQTARVISIARKGPNLNRVPLCLVATTILLCGRAHAESKTLPDFHEQDKQAHALGGFALASIANQFGTTFELPKYQRLGLDFLASAVGSTIYEATKAKPFREEGRKDVLSGIIVGGAFVVFSWSITF